MLGCGENEKGEVNKYRDPILHPGHGQHSKTVVGPQVNTHPG